MSSTEPESFDELVASAQRALAAWDDQPSQQKLMIGAYAYSAQVLVSKKFPAEEHWFCSDRFRPLASTALLALSMNNSKGVDRVYSELCAQLARCPLCARLYHTEFDAIKRKLKAAMGIKEDRLQAFAYVVNSLDGPRFVKQLTAFLDSAPIPDSALPEDILSIVIEVLYSPWFLESDGSHHLVMKYIDAYPPSLLLPAKDALILDLPPTVVALLLSASGDANRWAAEFVSLYAPSNSDLSAMTVDVLDTICRKSSSPSWSAPTQFWPVLDSLLGSLPEASLSGLVAESTALLPTIRAFQDFASSNPTSTNTLMAQTPQDDSLFAFVSIVSRLLKNVSHISSHLISHSISLLKITKTALRDSSFRQSIFLPRADFESGLEILDPFLLFTPKPISTSSSGVDVLTEEQSLLCEQLFSFFVSQRDSMTNVDILRDIDSRLLTAALITLNLEPRESAESSEVYFGGPLPFLLAKHPLLGLTFFAPASPTLPHVAPHYLSSTSQNLRRGMSELVTRHKEIVLASLDSKDSPNNLELAQQLVKAAIRFEILSEISKPQAATVSTTRSTAVSLQPNLWDAVISPPRMRSLLADAELVRSILVACQLANFLHRYALRKDQDPFPVSKTLNRVVRSFETLSGTSDVILMKLILDHEVLVSLFLAAFSSHDDLEFGALGVLSQVFDSTDTRADLMQKLMETAPDVTLQAFSAATESVRRVGKFSPCSKLIKLGKDVIDGMYHGGQALDASFKAKLSPGDTNELLVLWRTAWRFLTFTFEHTMDWGEQFVASVMKEFFSDEATYCQCLVDQFRFFEDDIPSLGAASKSNGEQLAVPMATTIEHMTALLRLRDADLLDMCFKVVMDIIELMKSFRVALPSSFTDVLVKCASNEIKNNLKAESISLLLATLASLGVISSDDIETILSKAAASKSKAKQIHEQSVPPAKSHSDKQSRSDRQPHQKSMMDYLMRTPGNTPPLMAAAPSSSIEPTAPSRLSQMDLVRESLKSARMKAPVKGATSSSAAAIHPPRAAGFNSRKAPAPPDVQKISKNRADEDSDSSSDEGELDGLFSNKSKTRQVPAVRNIDRPGFRASTALLSRNRTPTADDREKEKRRMAQRLNVDLSPLLKHVLSWNYHSSADTPNSALTPKHIKDSYSEVDDYEAAFRPLLLLECWQGIMRAKSELDTTKLDRSQAFKMTMGRRMALDDFTDVYASIDLSDYDPKSRPRLGESELVLLSYSDPKNGSVDSMAPNPSNPSCLAKVVSTTFNKTFIDVRMRTYNPGTINNYLAKGYSLQCLKLTSLTTIEREYMSLMALRYYDLMQPIINATPSPPPQLSKETIQSTVNTYGVNVSQGRAIAAAIDSPGVSLIQGPPGTGKTKTILGIVGAYLTSATISARSGHQASDPDVPNIRRILLCAPSNAAVDELVLRLKQGIRGSHGRMFSPKIVRLGQSDSINAQVRDVTLEELVDASVESDAQPMDESLRKDQREAVTKRNELRAKIQSSTALSGEQYSKLDEELRQADKMVRQLGRQLDAQRDMLKKKTAQREVERRKHQANILREAQVVCSTLSGSAHSVLASLNMRFDTVIIDEAAQCIELSALIPLKYGCTQCIMVGDPNQLPPTVLSQAAAYYKYEQSLFVRMFNTHKDRVYMLDTQFRMHPSISRFPSKEFYGGKLHDGPKMSTLTQRWWHDTEDLVPYKFFDVESRHAVAKQTKSLFNPVEANCIYELYIHLTTIHTDRLTKSDPAVTEYGDLAGKVGIISPYKRQVQELKNLFSRKLGSYILDQIDFNTVDGFQGQEKDIIILSCVRAQTDSRGVGFLGDTRRMNVAITRARSSLWIFGNEASLVKNPVWSKLIGDAKERHMFRRVHTGQRYSLRPSPVEAVPRIESNGVEVAGNPLKVANKVKSDSAEVRASGGEHLTDDKQKRKVPSDGSVNPSDLSNLKRSKTDLKTSPGEGSNAKIPTIGSTDITPAYKSVKPHTKQSSGPLLVGHTGDDRSGPGLNKATGAASPVSAQPGVNHDVKPTEKTGGGIPKLPAGRGGMAPRRRGGFKGTSVLRSTRGPMKPQ